METVLSITPENIVTIGFMALVFILIVIGVQLAIKRYRDATV